MTHTAKSFVFYAVFTAFAGMSSVGCSSKTTPETEEHAEGGSPDIVLEGSVTDEMQVAFESTLEQKKADATSGRGPTLSSPTEGTVFDKTAPPTFRWNLTTANDRPTTRRSFREVVSMLLFGERTAHAHGTPTTGPVTFLVFSIPGDDRAVRVLTSRNEFTPTVDQMTKLANGGQTITLTLTGFIADENRVAEGPFTGSTNRYTIAP